MPEARVKSGDVLAGKYRVERVLGTGGMGMVVAARHLELGQRVALKLMLKEAMSDPAHAERFLREARAAVQLQSPHTARVLDVGRLANGEPFMVMEYLEGEDLDVLIQRQGALPPHTAVDYILQVCEAFAEAHGMGMIHRDIKLKNLFLTKTVDGRPFLKVLDFGLAKQIGLGQRDISLTATSAVFGSPQYMSPEQMRSAKDVDTRSDIWSIGVCLFELLTGKVPFDAGGLAEICAMVLKDPVPHPSALAPVPPDLEAVVMRCLEKDPTRRFQSVAELAAALEPWAAIEGSANRIHQVMASAKKLDMPTIATADPGQAPSARGRDGRTLSVSAWDTTPMGDRGWKQSNMVYVLASAAAAAMLVLFVGVWFVTRAKITADPPASATSAPPPVVEAPLPTPTATGTLAAAPGATSTEATATATSVAETPKPSTTATAPTMAKTSAPPPTGRAPSTANPKPSRPTPPPTGKAPVTKPGLDGI